jgi:hypothetical protein
VLAGADHESGFGPFSTLVRTFHEIRFDSHWFSFKKSRIKKEKAQPEGRAFELIPIYPA